MSERKLAILLHADVVGSTALVQQNETLAHERIQDTFRRFSETISNHNGIAHEIRGDALVAEFSRASDAVSASLAFQTVNINHNDQRSEDIRPALRIGIAMGEVVVADNTVTGEGVVLAQRLEQLAEPGGVCIQGATYETLPKRLPFDYENLGERHFKGFDEPVRAYAASLKPEGVIPEPVTPARPEATAPDLPEKPSVAVLPFTNMSGDPEQEYFSDGITEDIITELSRFRTLFVVARNSSFVFKGQAMDVKELSRRLGVRYIVEGSVRKAADRIRITSQLIDATTANNLWAERYDRLLTDVFAIQDEISRSIAAAIEPELGVIEGQRSRSSGAETLDAWECYHRGLWHLYKFTAEELTQAEALFERAISLDPEFGPAYARLAYMYIQKVWYGPRESRRESLTQAIVAAKRAVGLDDKDAVGHFSLGRAYMLQGLHEPGIAELKTAVELNPGFAQAHFGLGQALVYAGREGEALSLLQEAIRLSPHDPHLWTFFHVLALAYYGLGKLDDAELAARASVRLPNTTYWAFATLTSILGNADKLDEAKLILQELLSRVPEYSCSCAEDDFLITERAYRSREFIELYVEGLRKAGVTE